MGIRGPSVWPPRASFFFLAPLLLDRPAPPNPQTIVWFERGERKGKGGYFCLGSPGEAEFRGRHGEGKAKRLQHEKRKPAREKGTNAGSLFLVPGCWCSAAAAAAAAAVVAAATASSRGTERKRVVLITAHKAVLFLGLEATSQNERQL
jgi:hypothetical protein